MLSISPNHTRGTCTSFQSDNAIYRTTPLLEVGTGNS